MSLFLAVALTLCACESDCCFPSSISKPKNYLRSPSIFISAILIDRDTNSRSLLRLCTVNWWCRAQLAAGVILCKSVCQFVTRSTVIFFNIFSSSPLSLSLRIFRLVEHMAAPFNHRVAVAASVSGKLKASNMPRVRPASIGSFTIMATWRYEFKINIKWKRTSLRHSVSPFFGVGPKKFFASNETC